MNVSSQSTARRILVAIAAGAALLSLSAAAATPDLQRLFAPYQQLLDRHLAERRLPHGGLVSAFDYPSALASESSLALLDVQRERLANFDTAGLDSRDPALAFWINAYNYFMLDHLLENPVDDRPASSVRDFGSFLNPYRFFERKLFVV